jgi:hypothetical protein
MVTPCIFVSNAGLDNTQLSFDGRYDTQTEVKLNVLAETQSQLENALSLLAASVDLTFPQLPKSVWPLNSMGDCKSGYNYVQVKSDYEDSPFYTITDVRTHKFSDAVQVDEAIFVGEAQLTIDIPRHIR